MDLDSIKKAYNEQGYVIIPFSSEYPLLDHEDLIALREVSERAIERTRRGDWPHRRVVGKQFPPYDTGEAVPDVWGVQHLMHYGLGEPAFTQWYGSKRLAVVMSTLLECEENEIQMGESRFLRIRENNAD